VREVDEDAARVERFYVGLAARRESPIPTKAQRRARISQRRIRHVDKGDPHYQIVHQTLECFRTRIHGVAALDGDERAVLACGACRSVLRFVAHERDLIVHRLEDAAKPREVPRKRAEPALRRTPRLGRDRPHGTADGGLTHAWKVGLAEVACTE
jgi:hypothetical protein